MERTGPKAFCHSSSLAVPSLYAWLLTASSGPGAPCARAIWSWVAEVRTGLWHLEALGEGGALKDTEHRTKEGNLGRRTASSSGKAEFLCGGGEAFFWGLDGSWNKGPPD